MIRHAWTVVCEKSIIDRDTNNISLDVMEKVQVSIPPLPEDKHGIIAPIRMEICSLWYRSRDDTERHGMGRLRIEIPGHEAPPTSDFPIDLSSHLRIRTRVRLNGLPIRAATSENYYIVTELEIGGRWTEVARVPLEIESR